MRILYHINVFLPITAIDLWRSYVEFVEQELSPDDAMDTDESNWAASFSEESIKRMREIFVRAVEATQYDLTKVFPFFFAQLMRSILNLSYFSLHS